MSNKNEDPTPTPWSEGDERAAGELARKAHLLGPEDLFPDDYCEQCDQIVAAIRTAILAERARVAGERVAGKVP